LPVQDKKYSQELRELVSKMIIVKQEDRCDVQLILSTSETMLEKLRKQPKIDSIVIMEDIH